MPDITLCRALHCPAEMRETCLRHRAPSSDRQAWNDYSTGAAPEWTQCANGRLGQHLSLEGYMILPNWEAEARRARALQELR